METADELEEVLNSLDHVQRAKAPGDFRDKLQQRLQFVPKQVKEATPRLGWALAAMISLAILNSFLLYSESTTNDLTDSTVDLVEETFNYETSLY